MRLRAESTTVVKKQDAYMGIRLYREELQMAKVVARKYRQSVSELVRQLIREEARKAGVQ